MIIRDYKEDDFDFLSEKQNLLNLFHYELDNDYYRPSSDSKEKYIEYIKSKIDDENFKILIYEIENEIIGYVMGWIMERPPIYSKRKTGYLSNIYVDERFRNEGIGKKLYFSMEQWFIDKAVDFVEIKADTRNIDTINKFRKYGFKDLSMTFYKKF